MALHNHRSSSLKTPRRTAQAYPGQNVGIRPDHPMSELAYFDFAFHNTPRAFGKREPSGLRACASNCGHPGCKRGCTLLGRFD